MGLRIALHWARVALPLILCFTVLTARQSRMLLRRTAAALRFLPSLLARCARALRFPCRQDCAKNRGLRRFLLALLQTVVIRLCVLARARMNSCAADHLRSLLQRILLARLWLLPSLHQALHRSSHYRLSCVGLVHQH